MLLLYYLKSIIRPYFASRMAGFGEVTGELWGYFKDIRVFLVELLLTHRLSTVPYLISPFYFEGWYSSILRKRGGGEQKAQELEKRK